MRLLKLEFRHFKGFGHYVFEPGGHDAAVYAENGRGKTSLADGLSYLLHDKDSLGRVPADAGIKPVNPDGTPKREGDSEVEAVLDLEPGTLALRKVYREVWSRPRGSAQQILSGHTTDYFLDGVPVKKGEYEARVKALCDEHIFRLITDPAAFMSDKLLPWIKRRAVLLEICGGVSDADVYAADPALSELPGILGGRKLEDHKKVCKARYKAVDEERERIPTRIDEATRALPEALQANGAAGLQTRMESLRRTRAGKEQERVRIGTGGEVAQLQRRIAELDTEMARITQRARAAADQAAQAEQRKLADLQTAIDARQREANRARADVAGAEHDAERLAGLLDGLRADWHTVSTRQFTDSTDDTCPACEQALPADRVEEARARALAEFNAHKSTDLEANQAEGKRRAAALQAARDMIAQRSADAERAEASLATLQAQAAELWARINALRSGAPDVAADPEYVGATIEREQLQEQIAALREGSREALDRVVGEIAALDQQIAAAEADLGRIAQREAGLARIAELKAEERKLAAELEDLQRQLFLMDQFELRQADLLEERVNAYFETVRWQLSERQINEGTKPCCIALVGGVPYGGGLNTAAEINAGLEIIDILGRHYGVRAPVFMDRAESVVTPRRIGAQVIRLVVSAQDRTLRVERQPAHQYEEAI